jgi:phenylalanyl-tRNA synthetase alpha chain
LQNLEQLIESADTLVSLEEARIGIFGKKGVLAGEFAKMKSVPNEEKKEYAKNLNIQKANLTKLFEMKKSQLLEASLADSMKKDGVDVTMFNSYDESGALHPVNETMNKIIDYFVSMNFSIEEGPLVEDDFHNFEALNLPKYHPARDMQDTFYMNDEGVLRTHTSPVQIRTMMNPDVKPPIRLISPGPVFRRDFDVTHTPMFHQVEGLVVDEEGKISFAHLKFILEDFLHYMFGDVDIRFRPSFFPFTEPSAEVDISCVFCEGKGCRICSHTGWLEVLGSGMVDPNVFKAVGYENVSGYAFGLGVERFAMLIHKIPDLRSLFEADLRLLEQFR